MRRRSESLVPNEERAFFLSMVRALFAQRRKTIRNNLLSSNAFSSRGREFIEKAFTAASLSGSERAEALSFDQLVILMHALK